MECRSGVQGLAAEKRQVPATESVIAGRAPPSSGSRGHPPRAQLVRAERGNPIGVRPLAGKRTARKAQSPGGNRMTEKRKPAAERQRETRDMVAGPSSQPSRPTGRIPGLVPGRESALTRSGGPVEKKMTEAPEPEDKLDAATTVEVNGPEDAPFDWRAVDWRRAEDDVRRLRQRIFTASQAGDLKKVRNLQKLMLRSRANTLVSVRRVTERNAGRLTAGVDGEVAITPEAKAKLAARVHDCSEPFQAMPVRRVYIPKRGSSTKRRPLGIPALIDRCHQARVVSALEPEWEARFEPRSYGFRPGRGCHDAIEAIYLTAYGKRTKRRWVLDADLASAFDLIAHDHILAMLGTFPARGVVKQWLKAGVVEHGRLSRTEEGTPQGGIVSPVLLNVALRGMEQAAGVRYEKVGSDAAHTERGSPVLVRYADDLIVLCHTRQEAEQAKARLAMWLAPRGLAFNEDKTRIVCLEEGFDFLRFNVRRYHGKLLIRPSKAAVRRIRERLRTEMRSLRGTNARAVIRTINPIIRGWAAYYRTVVSSKTFRTLDHHLWKLTYKWATYSHSNKPKFWVTARYFGKFNRTRQGPMGVRRPANRRLHAPVRLDPDRPTPDRHRHGVPRRPCPWRLLGRATTQDTPAGRQDRPLASQSPGRPLPDLPGSAPARRGRAANPARVGTVAHQPPHQDHRGLDAGRHVGHG